MQHFYDGNGTRVATVFESMGAAILVASRLNMGDDDGWTFVAEQVIALNNGSQDIDKALIRCHDAEGNIVGYF